MLEAMKLVGQDDLEAEVAQFYLALSDMLLHSRRDPEAWQLQSLTDLSQLPDYEEAYYYRNDSGGAPVDAEGNPVFHVEPASWDAAISDGQRWRWCLAKAVETNPGLKNGVAWRFADFLYRQFGVQTMQQFFGRVTMATKKTSRKLML